MALEKTTEIVEHNKRREAEAVSRKATSADGKSEGEWLFKLPFAGRGMSNVRLSTGEIANFAVSVTALDPAPGTWCWISALDLAGFPNGSTGCW